MKWNEEEAVVHRRQHQQYVPDVMNPGRRFFFLLVGCRISAKRQQWYGNEAELWFYQKEGMLAVVVLEGTQNPLATEERRQIQQRGP